MMKKLVIGSSNKSKVEYYRQMLSGAGIEVVGLDELMKDKIEVLEDGENPEENAVKKAEAYSLVLGLSVLAVDYGLYIDKFADNKQPGNDVRRVDGKRLDDEEMLEYYKTELDKVGGESDARWVTGVAVAWKNGEVKSRSFLSETFMTSRECPIRNEGEPLNSLQYMKKMGKYKAEMTKAEMASINQLQCDELKDFVVAVLTENKNLKKLIVIK